MIFFNLKILMNIKMKIIDNEYFISFYISNIKEEKEKENDKYVKEFTKY